MSKESVANNRVVDLFKVEVKIKGVRGLAREVGISPAIITRYMNGKVGDPTTATLEKLAAYFGVSVPWLRGEEDPVGIHQVVAEIREALGVGDDVALADLPGIIRTLLEDDLK